MVARDVREKKTKAQCLLYSDLVGGFVGRLLFVLMFRGEVHAHLVTVLCSVQLEGKQRG